VARLGALKKQTLNNPRTFIFETFFSASLKSSESFGVRLKMQSIRSEARERTRVRVVVRLRPVNGECAVQVTGALD
jgi:hypothetical protein